MKTEVNKPMLDRTAPDTKNIAKAVKEEAERNQAFAALCKVMSERERTRDQITMRNLVIVMAKAGFNFPKAQYEGVLRFLASLGVGTLEYNNKGMLTGLKDIKYTLQSIGGAAKGITTMKTFSPASVYEDLPVQTPPVQPEKNQDIFYKSSLTVLFDGKVVVFDLPRGMSTRELGIFLAKYYEGMK